MKKLVLIAFVLLIGCTMSPATENKCTGPTVSIATFNIQTFGPTKASNETTMQALASIVQQFDLVAIQEIRDKEGNALPKLANMTGYSYVVSERLGSTSSKEQYAFLYNDNITFEDVSYVYNNSLFERPPFVAKFSAGGFDFFIANAHVKPKEGRTREEIEAMAGIVNSTEDYILLGDLNADCNYLQEDLGSLLPELYVMVPSAEDTTVSSTDCAYDRIIITGNTREDFKKYGVYRFDSNMTQEQAKTISDHYPVYAEFYTVCDTN